MTPLCGLVPSVPPLQKLRQPRNSDDPAAFAQASLAPPDMAEWGGYAALAGAIGLPSAGPLLISSGPLR